MVESGPNGARSALVGHKSRRAGQASSWEREEALRVIVPIGATVKWVNDDQAPFSIVSDRGDWRSDLVHPGQSFCRTFRDEGLFAYYSTAEPRRRGLVVVTDDA